MTESAGSAREARDLYAASYARLVGMLTLAAGSRSEAEEVVQEAFVRLLTRWDQVCRYDDPQAWVRMVAFRLLSNRHRRARNLVTALARPARHQGACPPTVDNGLDVTRALATLPLGQRQVVVLHHLLDLSITEVAAELRIPAGTVKSRLARARHSLAPLLREVPDHA